MYLCKNTHTHTYAIQQQSMKKHHIFEQDQGDWDGWREKRETENSVIILS